MNNYNLNSTVTSQEAEALKEMIFKRARERAKALNEDVQSSFTSSIQNDVMDLARDSFVASKNPFSQIVETPKQEETVEEEKIANALTIPWGGMVKVEEEENYIFINMLGYEAMIMKKSDCEEIEEVIEYIKEKLGDEKKYIVVENKK